MADVGYARVSTVGQNLEQQIDKLKHCDKVFQEKLSGADASRPALRECLDYLREGDTLHVVKIDRLARSTPHLYKIMAELEQKGVAFKVVDDPSIDTTHRTGKLLMGLLALIAEFENDIRRERQVDGIRKAKERGTRFGRRPKVDETATIQIRDMRGQGMSPTDIGRRLGLSRATVYRALANDAVA